MVLLFTALHSYSSSILLLSVRSTVPVTRLTVEPYRLHYQHLNVLPFFYIFFTQNSNAWFESSNALYLAWRETVFSLQFDTFICGIFCRLYCNKIHFDEAIFAHVYGPSSVIVLPCTPLSRGSTMFQVLLLRYLPPSALPWSLLGSVSGLWMDAQCLR